MSLPAEIRAALVSRGLAEESTPARRQRDGLSNRVWQIGQIGVKVYGTGETSPLFPNAPVAEWTALDRLSGTGLAPAPRALFMAGAATVLVYDWIAADLPRVGARELGRALRRVWLPAPGGEAGRDPVAEGHEILARCADQSLLTYAPSTLPIGGASVHLHGDPVPGNVIATTDGPVLIDWQAATAGTPWHDLSLALSPALRQVAGAVPWTSSEQSDLVSAAGLDPLEWQRIAPAFHWRMACHCQWRLERGHSAYGAGLALEIRAALRATSPTG